MLLTPYEVQVPRPSKLHIAEWYDHRVLLPCELFAVMLGHRDGRALLLGDTGAHGQHGIRAC
eukprot:9108536-Alexandrium_andersonii.AAC.1